MPRNQHRFAAFKLPVFFFTGILLLAYCETNAIASPFPGDTEYSGSLDGELVPHTGDVDQVIFHPLRDLSKIKLATPLEAGVNVTAGRLYDPLKDKSSLLAVLVEPEDDSPILYADLNGDGVLADNERFELKRGADDNPYILETTLQLPLKNP